MLKLKKNISLAKYTTFKIGGPARYFSEVKNSEELKQALKWAEKKNLPYFILGGGSNLLVSDKGFEGLVIKCQMSNVKCLPDSASLWQAGQNKELKYKTIYTEAGALLSQVVNLAIKNNLTGLEWAAGIPGTVGGAVRGNAGWKPGLTISELVQAVKVFNVKRKEFNIFSNKDCEFQYRKSVFIGNKNYIIGEVILKLAKGEKREIEKKVKEFIAKRSDTQPKFPSAGSVFKNVPFEELKKRNPSLAKLAMARAAKYNLEPAGWAGWIIDRLDLRGKTIGGAKISSEHANFIVNTGKATADDVVKLISYIKQQVRDKLKLQLEEEIQYLGF